MINEARIPIEPRLEYASADLDPFIGG